MVNGLTLRKKHVNSLETKGETFILIGKVEFLNLNKKKFLLFKKMFRRDLFLEYVYETCRKDELEYKKDIQEKGEAVAKEKLIKKALDRLGIIPNK